MWILPTLNRPEQCAAVLDRLTEKGVSTPGVVVVNDPNRDVSLLAHLPRGWTAHVAETNLGALGALNKIFELYPEEPWYGYIGDDEFVETEGFDTKLIAAAGAWDIAHGVDNLYGGKYAQGYLVVGGELARAVGFLALPECWHWFGLDNFWDALATVGACARVRVESVAVDHRHPSNGRAARDECYAVGGSRKDIDEQEFAAFLRYRFKDVVERVKKARAA